MAALPFGGIVIVGVSIGLAFVLPYCQTCPEQLLFGIHLSGLIAILTVARIPGVGETLRLTVASGVVVVMALALVAYCVHLRHQTHPAG